jgi:predicted alpha/beta-hydrolase family hydrolase
MTVGGLFLTPGAGSNRDQPSLLAIEAAVAPLPVERHDFPSRRAGKKGVDRAPVAIADVVLATVVFAERVGIDPASLVLGGRSFGGRMCSMAVAEGLPAAGLVLISYPLHPPGKPDRLRIEHLPKLTVPCLFVSGTRDPFGSPAELEEHTAVIPGPVTHVWVDGKGHDLKGADTFLAETVAAWLTPRGPCGPRG